MACRERGSDFTAEHAEAAERRKIIIKNFK
jgi:hypothetical protein